MSEDAFRKANNKMAGVQFIDLEELTDVSKEQDDIDFNEREELRRRLCQADARYRGEKEIYEWMVQRGLDTETLMNEMAAENEFLTSRIRELQEQEKNIRKRLEEENEEALWQELLSEEESRKLRSQSIHIRDMEKENKELRKENEVLTAELEQLSLGHNYEEEIQKLRTAEQEWKLKLEQVRGVLQGKNKDLEKKYTTLIQRIKKKEEYFKTIKELRREQHRLQQQLRRRQEEQILAAQKTASTVSAKDEEDEDETALKNERWRCLKGLWKGLKVAGHITLCVLLPVGIVASMVPVCNGPDPDCNLWDVAFNLLEYYGKLHYTDIY